MRANLVTNRSYNQITSDTWDLKKYVSVYLVLS